MDSVLQENPELFFQETCANSWMQKGLGGHSWSCNQCLGAVFYLCRVGQENWNFGAELRAQPCSDSLRICLFKHSGLGLSVNYFIISVTLNTHFIFLFTLKTFAYKSILSFEQMFSQCQTAFSHWCSFTILHFKDTKQVPGLIHLYFLLEMFRGTLDWAM